MMKHNIRKTNKENFNIVTVESLLRNILNNPWLSLKISFKIDYAENLCQLISKVVIGGSNETCVHSWILDIWN